MKAWDNLTKHFILITIGVAAWAGIAQAQTNTADSIVQVTAQAQGLEQVAPEMLPPSGTFWVMTSNGMAVPWPCPPPDQSDPVYSISDGIFLVDGTDGQVALNPRHQTTSTVESALEAQAAAVVDLIEQVQSATLYRMVAEVFGLDEEMDSPMMSSSMMSVADPDGLWLEITNYTSAISYLNLRNATNQVYAIWTTTNLLTPFTVEMELWPTVEQTNVLPFTVQNADRQYLFVRAEDWTGKDSDSDGIPDWWAWKYFGSVNVTDTNLDYSGNDNTFAEDFSNNIPPTVFSFTGVAATNNYVSTTTPSVQLNVAGSPYYIATLIDETNFSNAVWNIYSGSSVTVNLGLTEGWHEVWIGLRGHADDPANAVWQWRRLKLDFTSPTIVITNPIAGTVDRPVIQLQGFCTEALSRISYDLTNATGLLTNQLVAVEGQAYSTNTWEFTTNYFQAFDVPLTNGLNVITLHATDHAGNIATVITNFTLDYSAKTNLPVVQLLWPQGGMEIVGNGIVCRGQVNDDTATVTVQLVDATGATNNAGALVGRDGIFYSDNLVLAPGTNHLSYTVTDAVGNVATTNITVMTSDLGLTLDPVVAGQSLITGTIDNTNYTVYVNGVTATNNGDGTWSATIAPIGIGGGAVVVNAVNGGDPTLQQIVQPPQGVFVSARHSYYQDYSHTEYADEDASEYGKFDWEDGSGGSAETWYYGDWNTWFPIYYYNDWPTNNWPQSLPDGMQTNIYWNYVTNYSHPPAVTNVFSVGSPDQTEEHHDTYIKYQSYDERNTGDTEMKLATGGPVGSRQMNLWCISASATDTETGQPIPYDQIAIGSFGNLDTNGNLWVMLPDNDPPVVTPKVRGKYLYLFGANAREYILQVQAITNGNAINLDYNGATFCVGQQITFAPHWVSYTPTFSTATPPYSHATADWTLPGTCVNEQPYPTTCDAYYDENAALLHQDSSTNSALSTACWYVNKLQAGSVSLAMNLDFNGEKASINVSGTFDVYQPRVPVFNLPSAEHGTPVVRATNGVLGLIDHDMSFSHIIHSDFPGVAGYTQLINGEVSIATTGGTSPYLRTGVDSLDNVEFPRETEPIAPNGNPIFFDAPEVGLRTYGLGGIDNRNDKFIRVNYNTYLLFKPDGSGNIFVPLKLVTWRIDATATYGTPWTTTGNPVAAPTSADCTSFPHWTNTFSNWGN